MRVYGPYWYPSRRCWRVVLGDAGQSTTRYYAAEAEAQRDADALRAALEAQADVTVGAMLERYLDHLGRTGKRANTIASHDRAVRMTLDLEQELSTVCAAHLRDALARRAKLAVATRHTDLRHTRSFLAWAAERGLYPARQLRACQAIKVEGVLNQGKDPLTVDEARRYTAQALAMGLWALQGVLPLVLGLRASEVASRAVRDLDDAGRLLWIRRGKTKRASRVLEVPAFLRQPLLELAGDRAEAQLWDGATRFSVWFQVRRICELAGVPVVSAQALRATHATLAEAAGATSHFVAAALGHADEATTLAHYTQPAVREQARGRRALLRLVGDV